MEIGPIWRALLRNKSTYVLIALQIAVTMAIMVNSISIIQERSRMMARPSGIDEDNTFYIRSVGFAPDFDVRGTVTEDLENLRNLPGVRNAILTNTVPLHGGGWSMGLQLEPTEESEDTGVAVYFVDEHALDTFDLNLVAGRNFTPSEIEWYDDAAHGWPPVAIITQEIAAEMFPDDPDNVVGKTVYIADTEPMQIIGVVEKLQAAWNSWSGVERSLLAPEKREGNSAFYVIRTEPGMRDSVMPEVENLLAESNKTRIIRNMTSMADVRQKSYGNDSAMIKLLVFIVALLTAITSLGIVGLASFNVARRTRQIGTRRALGASRPAILRYFMLENFLVSGVGILAGAVLAVGLNIWLVQMFNLTPISWYLIPMAMLVLWLVGQIAVFSPAWRASLISPSTATRAI